MCLQTEVQRPQNQGNPRPEVHLFVQRDFGVQPSDVSFDISMRPPVRGAPPVREELPLRKGPGAAAWMLNQAEQVFDDTGPPLPACSTLENSFLTSGGTM